ncbi:transposase [Paracoccus sp. MC1854]|uniref:integrase core domain-containing protein n=1 Tax=Paracoccus sp. MC1854 TaxID=2760306 RepID=UPI001602A59C|nr:transposase [Paracoccus sp. MC1854]
MTVGCATLGFRAATAFFSTSLLTGQGSAFLSRDLDLRACARRVVLEFSRAGKPTDNGFIEAFNNRLGSECPNAHWFMNFSHAPEGFSDASRTVYPLAR